MATHFVLKDAPPVALEDVADFFCKTCCISVVLIPIHGAKRYKAQRGIKLGQAGRQSPFFAQLSFTCKFKHHLPVLLRFFRINDPTAFGTLCYYRPDKPFLFIFTQKFVGRNQNTVLGRPSRRGKLMYIQVFDDTPRPGQRLVWPHAHPVWPVRLLATSYCMAIVFFQASYFAVLLINNKAYAENTYLPRWSMACFAFSSFDLLELFMTCLPPMVLLFALKPTFSYEVEFKIQQDEIVLKLGILSLAIFIVFS